MADEISFKMITTPWNAWIDDREQRSERAAMFTVREAGRMMKREARSRAPVYGDRNAPSYRAWRQSGGGGSGPVRGLLKNSISPSKRLQRVGLGWQLKVGPRGQRVHLYAGKIEALEPYMEPAYEIVAAEMQAIAQAAFDRAWR